MNPAQKPVFPLAKELPPLFKPCKLQVHLLNYCSFQGNIFGHAKRPDQTAFNHKQDLHIEKIVKGREGQKGGENFTSAR